MTSLRVDFSRRAAVVLMLALAACLFMPEAAQAAASPMGSVLCNIIGLIYGNLGRALATLAIIFLGVGATLGKVSWGLALMVAAGISVIFSAPFIINQFLGAINPGMSTAVGCVINAGGGGTYSF